MLVDTGFDISITGFEMAEIDILIGEGQDAGKDDPADKVPAIEPGGGLGKVKHREFAMASGEMSEVQFTGFLSKVFDNLARHAVDGALVIPMPCMRGWCAYQLV